MVHFMILIGFIAASALATAAQQADPATCPLHAAHQAQAVPASGHDDAHAEMEARGARAMGFDQARASHHFRLTAKGGNIEIHTNAAGDTETRRQINAHLETIARQFKQGDFSIPVHTHGAVPEGVAGLKRFKDDITYMFEPTASGGRLVISAGTGDAFAAVHEFLRYQIREHRTGDPLSIRG